MSKAKAGFFKRTQAKFCHHCPVCSHARKKPESFIGQILHNPRHTEHCPTWKAEKELYQES
ncbi:MAG: hypothetical protein GY847_06575 [Proteobacteria bacterium]|nr:hypothetical protein [Pseudomonadota bacterium]